LNNSAVINTEKVASPFISVISLLSVKVCPSCEALICMRIH
ncbi:hypothetical protein HMPREF1551_00652, partial [Capnocytophaga sp. oral taxon 863 str. F0517]